MKYLILVSLLALAACAPITKQNIHTDPAYSNTFTVSQPYQQVFDVLLKRSQACYLDRPTSKQLTLVGNRDNRNKTANITMEYVYAMAEHDVVMMIDITAGDDNKQTQISVYAHRRADVKKAELFEKWLNDPRNQVGCA